MEERTSLANKILTAEERIRCDTACKKILAEKSILALILQQSIPAYAGIPAVVIAEKYIEGTPVISSEPVHPDTPAITGTNTEDSALNEGTVFYDIKFNALLPDMKELFPVIINVEAQQKYNPSYPILKRGVYYTSRMISAQKGTIFTNSQYDKIRNVYSIWVCMNAPSDLQNTITEFHTGEYPLFGTGGHNPKDYDLTSIVMICLGADDSYSDGTPNNTPDNPLLRMLNMLFSSNVNPSEKCRILEENYNVPMTTTIESEVSTMCNFSEGFFERGLEKGMLEGERRGHLISLYDLTLSGIITLSIAAQQAGQTEEEFAAGLDAYRDGLKKTVNA